MSNYDRELIELLVPTIWDRHYAWGMVDERRPDPDMPKTAGLKNRGNTLWAHLADIRRAWNGADIPVEERQALLLVGGMGMTHHLAAEFAQSPRRTMSDRFERGVGRLADYLNGTEYADFEPDNNDY